MSEEAPETPPARQRIGERVAAMSRKGRDELTRKGGVPDQAHGLFRQWFRKVWEARGGGLYAVGFAVAFLYFEINDILFDDIPKLAAINVLSADLIGFIIEFIIDTFINMGLAFAWPAWVVMWNEPYGLIMFIAALVLFPRFVKEPMEHWLFEGKAPPPPKKSEKKNKKQGAKDARD